MHSNDNDKKSAAKALRAKLDEVLNSENHKWYLNKMSAKQLEIRKNATKQFKAKYK